MIEILAGLIIQSQIQNETEFSFDGAGIKLQGVLTTPAEKPKATIVMMPGSGPTDRDGNQPPSVITNVLKDLSNSLVDGGFATLRFDKRPVARYQNQWPKTIAELSPYFNLNNHLQDAKAAIAYASENPKTKETPVYLLGHSEGGMFAIALGQAVNAKGIILLAAPGRNMGDILIDQVNASIKKAPISTEQKEMYGTEMARIIGELRKSNSVPKNVPIGLKSLFNESAIDLLHDYITFDPKPFAEKFQGSVLILNGSKDIQIDPIKDAKLLYSYFSIRKDKKTEIEIIDGVSHNFKVVKSDTDPAFSGPLIPSLSEKIKSFLNSEN